MPIIKFVGKTTDFSGKTLWEIVGNLKDFGVGRLVYRNVFQRYPEPCFYRVLKVETVGQETEEYKDRKVRAYVEKIFRGKRYPKAVEILSTSYKSDYRLIPKSEEKLWWDRLKNCQFETRVLPSEVPFPPLLEHLLKEEMKNKGKPVVAPKLKLKIKEGRDRFYRTAKEDETPTVTIEKSYETKIFTLP